MPIKGFFISLRSSSGILFLAKWKSKVELCALDSNWKLSGYGQQQGGLSLTYFNYLVKFVVKHRNKKEKKVHNKNNVQMAALNVFMDKIIVAGQQQQEKLTPIKVIAD
jgi:hypothetical protein